MSRQGSGSSVRGAARKRTAILAELVEASARKPALVDAVDVSRSTVDRAVDELVDAGLVARDERNGVFRATVAGELALAARREYEAFTDAVGGAVPLLEAVPGDAPIDRALFEAADVAIADPQAPEAALAPAVDALSEAERLRGFAPVVKSNYASLLYDEVTTRGLEVELVVERETLESAAAVVRGREELSELFAADEVDLLVTDASLPYALWQTTAAPAEGEGNRGAAARAGVAVHDGGAVVGLLASDAAAAVEWACEVYERFRADAEPLRAGRLATD